MVVVLPCLGTLLNTILTIRRTPDFVNGFRLDQRDKGEALGQLQTKIQNDVHSNRMKRSPNWMPENGSVRGTESPSSTTTTTSPPPPTQPKTSSTSQATPTIQADNNPNAPVVTFSPPVIDIPNLCKRISFLCKNITPDLRVPFVPDLGDIGPKLPFVPPIGDISFK
ncbi:hypothetical protein ACF0H5_009070 [Mactra antiquata]